MKPFVLHVGLPKTATTSLQLSVYPNHSQISYMGKILKPGGTGTPRDCSSVQTYAVLKPILWPKGPSSNGAEKSGQNLKSYFLGHEGQKTVLASWEGVGFMRPDAFELLLNRLRTALPGARLLFCLRHPVTWLESMYLHALRENILTDLQTRQFLNRLYLPIEDWMTNSIDIRGGQLRCLLGHALNIKNALRLLGPAQVGVAVFERLHDDAEGFYRDIAGFLEIDPEQTLSLAKNVHVNTRLSTAQLEFIQQSQHDSERQPGLRSISKNKLRQELLRLGRKCPESPPARVRLDPSLRLKIEHELRPDYKRLQQDTGLDLEMFGYPL